MNQPRDRGPEGDRVHDVPINDPWRLWGPYQAGRQWGTVREDYSADGDAWTSFPFDQAHARAYRWGEDGIGGLCDSHGFLHLAVALWNGHDDRLKERWFGLTNPQGNHGEDVKEYWWPLDATPTHSYGSLRYRYPQAAFPYAELVAKNAQRGKDQGEYELAHTGVLDGDRFFDVVITHAKASAEDVLFTVTATNHGPDPALLHLVPQLWFRNTWSWGRDERRPSIELVRETGHDGVRLVARHAFLGTYQLDAEANQAPGGIGPDLLACDNETDFVGLYGAQRNQTPYPKNGVDAAIVHGDRSRTNPQGSGTKAALHYTFDAIPPGGSVTTRVRLRRIDADADADADDGLDDGKQRHGLPTAAGGSAPTEPPFGPSYDEVLSRRRAEADALYAGVIPPGTSPDDALVARRAFAGLLWGKQAYRYTVREWLDGDPAGPAPPPQRERPEPAARNTAWTHLELADVMSMPDDWEYPWFAAWDLAFHCVALAHVDAAFAKDQLLLLCREWAQHPTGQLPAYEWSFSDVNPPVHAWAAWQVYQVDGARDRAFLGQIQSKLLLNNGWWVNQKDLDGTDLFGGGFLGMDNISVFDRSRDVPPGGRLEQSDATSWVAFSFLWQLRISLELARHDAAWSELPSTFLERFLAIAEASEEFGSHGVNLWDEADAFFYDVLIDGQGVAAPVRVRSYVGLVPLLAVGLTPAWASAELAGYALRRGWLEEHRPDLLARRVIVHDDVTTPGATPHEMADRPADGTLSLVGAHRRTQLLTRMLDEGEFLSRYGLRSLSAAYRDETAVPVGGHVMEIQYTPGESASALFGGNSNWRGPLWMPINVLLVDALRTYAAGAGRQVQVELPTGSGRLLGLAQVADDLTERLLDLFRPSGPTGRRPSQPADHPDTAAWNVHPTFSEFFHGDTGAGLGASHQTGWTALVAHLICTKKTTP